MDVIFLNSEDGKTSDLHRQLLDISDSINWKRNDKNVGFLAFTIHGNI